MNICETIPATVIETVVKGIMENMPECSQSMDCLSWKYEEWCYKFRDHEDGKVYVLDKEKLLATFPLLFSDKFPKGLIPPPQSADEQEWDDWLCQSDVVTFDAFVQLAIFGEVIYG